MGAWVIPALPLGRGRDGRSDRLPHGTGDPLCALRAAVARPARPPPLAYAGPTPRGGGIAIVAAMLACGWSRPARSREGQDPIRDPAVPRDARRRLGVGWLDDHGGRSALSGGCDAHHRGRMGVRRAFAAVDRVSRWPNAAAAEAVRRRRGASAMTFAIVWSINLHNFMDGIDGLLTLQAIWTFVARRAGPGGRPCAALAGCAFGSAVRRCLLAFCPFNFPRARLHGGRRQRRCSDSSSSNDGRAAGRSPIGPRCRDERPDSRFGLRHRRDLATLLAHAARPALV